VGARRISHELSSHDLAWVPSRATVHRVLTRNGMVDPQAQKHKRKRWQRKAPMHLWQLDIVGGVPLADGLECKLLTSVDDHSRFIVIATVVVTPSAREIGEAFIAAMRRYGVPLGSVDRQRRPLHRPVPQTAAGGSAVREDLPR
jgi:transposase InsO family protein